jgi:hypothetical protein
MFGPKEILSKKYSEEFSISKDYASDFGILLPIFNEGVDYDVKSFACGHSILADAIFRILEDENLRNNLIKSGCSQIMNFSSSVFRDKLLAIINRLI